MRGYRVFRHDREGREKGGVAILVENTLPAQELTVSTNNHAEIHGLNIAVNDKEHKIFNVYSQPNRICLSTTCSYRTVGASFLEISTVTQRHGIMKKRPT